MNYVEQCLFDFFHNINLIDSLTFQLASLTSVMAQGYNVHVYNSQNDPVTDVLIRKERIENRINRIKKKIIPVKKLDDSLSLHELRTHQMKNILHKKYWQHKNLDELIHELGLSKSTIKRRNKELLQRAKDCFHDFHTASGENYI